MTMFQRLFAHIQRARLTPGKPDLVMLLVCEGRPAEQAESGQDNTRGSRLDQFNSRRREPFGSGVADPATQTVAIFEAHSERRSLGRSTAQQCGFRWCASLRGRMTESVSERSARRPASGRDLRRPDSEAWWRAGIDLTSSQSVYRNESRVLLFMGDIESVDCSTSRAIWRGRGCNSPRILTGGPTADVLKPWMNGMGRNPASIRDKWIIDFGDINERDRRRALRGAFFPYHRSMLKPVRYSNKRRKRTYGITGGDTDRPRPDKPCGKRIGSVIPLHRHTPRRQAPVVRLARRRHLSR